MRLTTRNLSPQRMFLAMAEEHSPIMEFKEGYKFEQWKKQAYPAVIKTLGDFPPTSGLNPEFIGEWEHDGLIKKNGL